AGVVHRELAHAGPRRPGTAIADDVRTGAVLGGVEQVSAVARERERVGEDRRPWRSAIGGAVDDDAPAPVALGGIRQAAARPDGDLADAVERWARAAIDDHPAGSAPRREHHAVAVAGGQRPGGDAPIGAAALAVDDHPLRGRALDDLDAVAAVDR